jgi:DNA-directed RNA polymerase subunit RPC12/RpoP
MICPKCLNDEFESLKYKYYCKHCNYEILKKDDKPKCIECSSSVLVKLKDYSPFWWSGKYGDEYICYLCKTEQFKRVEK